MSDHEDEDWYRREYEPPPPPPPWSLSWLADRLSVRETNWLVQRVQHRRRIETSRGSFKKAIPSDVVTSPAGHVVANWHNDVHTGAYRTCQQQPCRAVREVDR